MATDMYLKIDGIKGESPDDKHKEEIELLSWSWGVSQTGTFGRGGGGGAGKASFQDVSFTHNVDKASPLLMQACATGQHIKEALLTVRKAGKEQQEYYIVKLSDLLVSSVSTSAAGEHPQENVALNYSKIEFDYKPQKDDGTLGPAVKAGYDQRLNKKV